MSQRATVLWMLQSAEHVDTDEFLDAHIPRFGGRLCELRKKGHQITTERLKASKYRYRLIDPERVSSPSSAASPPATEDAFALQHAAGSLRAEERTEGGGVAHGPAAALFELPPTPHWRQDAA